MSSWSEYRIVEELTVAKHRWLCVYAVYVEYKLTWGLTMWNSV